MARIHIKLPERFRFSTEIPVYRLHINAGGHLDNALLLTIVSEARSRYFKFLGYSELDVEGYSIIVTDAAVQYLSEGFPDDVMVVEMAFGEANKYGGDLIWRMSALDDRREVARGKTGFVFRDRAQGKIALMPKTFFANTHD
ncbi:MAG: thioesterase family protein [Azonexus sp.]|jgi:4-hydroxybenzoyl-CoA thioesterase|nr:thioesterase family protein [Azonexus sp.]